MNTSIIQKALERLQQGELVICPTETVYGLVADSHNPAAIQKLFQIKERDSKHPLTIHIAETADMVDWAKDIPAKAYELAQQYWPGPLTLILNKADHVSSLITGDKNTIGLRCPSHPIAHELIKKMGHGLIMSSANISGQAAPTNAEEAKQQLGDRVELIIDDGACEHGLASTIIDLTGDKMKVLRQGRIVVLM